MERVKNETGGEGLGGEGFVISTWKLLYSSAYYVNVPHPTLSVGGQDTVEARKEDQRMGGEIFEDELSFDADIHFCLLSLNAENSGQAQGVVPRDYDPGFLVKEAMGTMTQGFLNFELSMWWLEATPITPPTSVQKPPALVFSTV